LGQADTGYGSDRAGGHALPVVQPEDLPVALRGGRLSGGREVLVDLAQQDRPLEWRQPFAALKGAFAYVFNAASGAPAPRLAARLERKWSWATLKTTVLSRPKRLSGACGLNSRRMRQRSAQILRKEGRQSARVRLSQSGAQS